jgi:hypothetical protein
LGCFLILICRTKSPPKFSLSFIIRCTSLSIPRGICTLSVTLVCIFPTPLQAEQNYLIFSPYPRQRSHIELIIIGPIFVILYPEPPQLGHFALVVPGLAREPLHAVHVVYLVYSIFWN